MDGLKLFDFDTCEICGGIPLKGSKICGKCERIVNSIKDSPKCDICGNFFINLNFVAGKMLSEEEKVEWELNGIAEGMEFTEGFQLCDFCLSKVERYIFKII